jgi:hypothetical protein
MITKELVLMRDVIIKHHPKFVNSADMQRVGMECPGYFNVEHLVEETLAAVGGYQFVDAEGYDFSDFSDSKTTTVNANTGQVMVGSVETKIGALRITAFNPFKGSLDYFYVPRSQLNRVRSPCYGNNSHKERILFNYSRKQRDTYGWFEDYRVSSFEELATCTS